MKTAPLGAQVSSAHRYKPPGSPMSWGDSMEPCLDLISGRHVPGGEFFRRSGAGTTRLLSNNRGRGMFQLSSNLCGSRSPRPARSRTQICNGGGGSGSTRSPGGQSIRACSRGSSAVLSKQPRPESSRFPLRARVMEELIPLISSARPRLGPAGRRPLEGRLPGSRLSVAQYRRSFGVGEE